MVLKEGMNTSENKDAIKADLHNNLEGTEGMALQSTIGLEGKY